MGFFPGKCLDLAPLCSMIRNMLNCGNDKFGRYVEIFKALSHPHRMRVFLALVSCCPPGTACRATAALPQCVGEISEAMGIAPSTLSHHLKELRRAGLIRAERKGKNVECSVDPAVLRDLAEFFLAPLEKVSVAASFNAGDAGK